MSLVRLKKGKKRFEIACYKNKVLEYRSGAETDLDNVLQIPNVFLSVSKGEAAPNADLDKAFGKGRSRDDIIQEILKKGEMQVGEKERGAQKDRLEREVVDIVAGKVVDPRSKRVYTAGMIEKALEQLSIHGTQHKQEEAHGKGSGTATPSAEGEEGNAKKREMPTWTGVVTTKSAKSQALEAMKALIAWQPIPVARARMRLRISCPTSLLKQGVKSQKDDAHDKDEGPSGRPKTIKDKILSYVEQVETQDTSGQEWEVVGFVEPGAFKMLGEFIADETKGKGRIEVLDMAVTHEGD